MSLKGREETLLEGIDPATLLRPDQKYFVKLANQRLRSLVLSGEATQDFIVNGSSFESKFKSVRQAETEAAEKGLIKPFSAMLDIDY